MFARLRTSGLASRCRPPSGGRARGRRSMQPRAAGSRSSRSRSESAPFGVPTADRSSGRLVRGAEARPALQREPFGAIVAGTAPSAVQRRLVRELPPCGRADGTNDRWIFGSTERRRRRFRNARRHRNVRTYQREPLRGLLGACSAVLEAIRPARTPRPVPLSGGAGSRSGWDFRGPPSGADPSSRPPEAAPRWLRSDGSPVGTAGHYSRGSRDR
jgi:hypothetical protein